MNSYLSNIRSYLIERYQQILNFCAFLVFAALLTLTVASVMEYQIEKKTIEVERLHLKELNILKWVSTVFILTGILMAQFKIYPYYIFMHSIGAVGWLAYGYFISDNVNFTQWRTVHEQDGAFKRMETDPQITTLYGGKYVDLPKNWGDLRLGHNLSIKWVCKSLLNTL